MFEEPIDLASENTGVVILVSKNDDTPALTTGGPGTLDDDLLASSRSRRLLRRRRKSGRPDVHPRLVRHPGRTVQLRRYEMSASSTSTARDDLSAPYFLLTGDCDLGATAVIDFGVTGNPALNPPNGIRASVKLQGPGCSGQGCTMTYAGPASSPDRELLDRRCRRLRRPRIGASTYSIRWETRPAGVTHSGTFGGVANPFVANDASGPVLYLEVTTSDAGVPDANSRNTGPPRSVIVTVGLNKPLQVRDPFEDAVLLRYASPSGSLNQALDCDIGINFTTEIIDGCKTTYGLNYDDFDKDGDKEWIDITCSGYPSPSDLPPPTFDPDPVPNCVAAKTGDVIAFTKGLEARFEKPVCTPNNWPEDQPPAGRGIGGRRALRDFFTNYDFANDPRYVTLIITDITAFEGSGSTNLRSSTSRASTRPGWDISSHTTGCPGENDPHPLFGTGYKKSKDNGDVWGHFVNIVVFSSSGLPNDPLCNFDELGTCIAVLVE